MRKLLRKHYFWAFLAVIAFFILSRLIALTRLPVFADEAIYIHWAQVAVREPDKYLFLSMLDGKPPLHNWLIIPFLQVFQDPLFAGRLLSGVAGLATLYVINRLVSLLGGDKLDRLFAMVIITITPMWHIHHRLALAESLLAFFFAASLYFGLKLFQTRRKIYILIFAIFFGFALWTKTNSLFFIPAFALIPLLHHILTHPQTSLKKTLQSVKQIYLQSTSLQLILAGIIGGLIFLTLKLIPLFPYLFTRSADYTFTVSEVLQGEWQYVLFKSTPRVMFWIGWYLTPFLIFPMLFGKRKNVILLAMAALYIAPLIAFGRVLSPRYFSPAAVPLTLMAVFGLKQALKLPKIQPAAIISISLFLISSLMFIFYATFIPEKTPFVAIDKGQYLTEWSSGYGIPEVRDFIKERIKTNKVTVGTEGYFGTLPDGLSIYFDKSPYRKNLTLYGVGQPIGNLPQKLQESSQTQETYLVVNSHRFLMTPSGNMEKIAEYPRPLNGPSLLLFKINPS